MPPKSACVFCPYHSDSFWINMKEKNPQEFNEAIEVDKFIRKGNDKLTDELYLHRSCVPLDQVEFKKQDKSKEVDMFNNACEGLCGV